MREKKAGHTKGNKKESVSRGREYSKSDRDRSKEKYVRKENSHSSNDSKKPSRSAKGRFSESADNSEKNEKDTYKRKKSGYGDSRKPGSFRREGSNEKFVRKEKPSYSLDTKKPDRNVRERFSESTDNTEKNEKHTYKAKRTGESDSRKPGAFHREGTKEKFVRKEKPSYSRDTKKPDRSAKGHFSENNDNTEKSEKKTYKGKRTAETDTRKAGAYRTKHSGSTYKPELKKKHADDGLIRLNRYIANAGICSRREADRLIESGAVSINGKIVTELGTKVFPGDVVNYGGQTLRKEKMVYLLLNKPKDYITTVDDPQGRKTVMALIGDACRERVYPVGRLDRATTGLLLFTNDGDIAKKLVHPRFGIKKIYHVELDKAFSKTDMVKISQGVELEDGIAKVDAVSYDGDGSDKKSVGIEIHSGKNRIVRRIFESLGYDVRKLDRVYFAGLTKKDLPRGKWRFLTEMEVNLLKMLK